VISHSLLKKGFILSVLGVAGAAHAQTISTLDETDITYFGAAQTETFGQTFTAPGYKDLTSYSFALDNFTVQQSFNFYIATWDPYTYEAGSILYEATAPSSFPGAGYVTYTASPSNLFLDGGDTYIAYISTSENVQHASSMMMEGSFDNYTGGSFVFNNNGTNTGLWTTGDWSPYYIPETAFSATFTTAPSPAAAIPMVFGGLVGLVRRKRARA
jgi:hypothetical protein